jgi:hypothetical protein
VWHVAPVVDAIYVVGSVRRVENAERLVGVEDESQVVDFGLIGREMNDIHCLSVRGSNPEEDPERRDEAHDWALVK